MEFKKTKLETIKNALQYAVVNAKTEQETAEFAFLLLDVETAIVQEAEQDKRIEKINKIDKTSNTPHNPPLQKTAVSSSCLLEVIDKLPHSKSRVPYTYHHDYLRQHSKLHIGMSRSYVASSHTADDIELHAIALTQILSEVGSDAIYHINSSDVLICKKAKEITEAAVSRYNFC